MDATSHSTIEEFDKCFTNNRIQMLKVLFPYLDVPMQKYMSVYIKFSEFQSALKFLKNASIDSCRCFPKKEHCGFEELIGEISCFCSKTESDKIQTIFSVFKNFEKYRELMQTMELFSDFMPGDGASNLFADTDIFKSFSEMNDAANISSDTSYTNEFNNTNTNSQDTGGMNDILMNMLSPEQKVLFEMLGGMTHAD